MKITFFVHHYVPHVGGVEKYVHELAKTLLRLGHEPCVVAGATEAHLPESEMHEGITIHRFPALRSPLRARAWLWRHRRLFTGADVVNVSNTYMLEYYWRMIGFLLPKRNVFLTRHGMSCRFPVPELDRRRAARSVRLAAGVVHDGAFIGKHLGVEPDLCPEQGLSPEADELTPVPEPPPRSATFVGRLEPDSGIRIYLDAVRRIVHEHRRPFMLHVHGEGSLLSELRETVAREELPVRFHGRTPDAQHRLSDSCFAFVDGRMVIQEAMARRRLVMAGYVDPLKRDYVCGESFSPFLIACADGEELARRTLHFIDHPEARAACVRPAYRYARTLSWPRTARAYLDFWTHRLAQHRQHPSLLQSFRLAWTLGREAITT